MSNRWMRIVITLTLLALTLTFAYPASGSQRASWVLVRTAKVPGAVQSGLRSVSCISSSDCFAAGLWSTDLNVRDSDGTFGNGAGVGGEPSSAAQHPLIEHFDGKEWTLSSAPLTAGALYAISCPSQGFCMAVGTSGSGTTLSERYQNGSWSVVPTPNGVALQAEGSRSDLESIDCTDVTRCVAVGAEIGVGTRSVLVAQQLIEQYDGSTWSLVNLPTAWHGQLFAVSCGTTACLTVGFGDPLPGPPVDPWSGRFGSEAFELNGNTWKEVAKPSLIVGSLSCVDAGFCLATPNAGNANGTFTAAFRHNRWRLVGTPRGSGPSTFLNDASCVSPSNCTVVGTHLRNPHPATDSEPDRSLVYQLDGDTWTSSTTPSVSGHDTDLLGVSCVAKRCVAVGQFGFFHQAYSNPIQVPTRSMSLVQDS